MLGRRAACFLALLSELGCASAAPFAAPTGRAARLLPPARGHYAIYRDGARVGTERFSITSSATAWRLAGTVELDALQQGYELLLDPRSEEPLAFEAWIEVAGARERVTGVVDGGYVAVELDSVLGARKGRVPYARGTMIELFTPLSNGVALALLLPELREGAPASVRTIALTMPLLTPSVLLQRYALAGSEGELRKIALTRDDGSGQPVALWVRDDGLPTRVRAWPEGGGSPYEMWLHLEGEERSP